MTTNPETPAKNNVIRYMPIGDSYTIGLGILNPEDRWPNLLVNSLKDEGISVKLIANPSVSGYEVTDAIERELPLFEREKPDLGTLFIGANDSFRQNNIVQFKNDYAGLVNRMQNSLTNRNNLILITIPNYARFPVAKNISDEEKDEQTIEQYNWVIREEAKRRNLKVADLYPINSMNSIDYLIPDGLHPNPKGMKVWKDVILPVVREVISKK